MHNSGLEYKRNDLSRHHPEHEEERDCLSEWALNHALQPGIDFPSADMNFLNDTSFGYSNIISLPFSDELSSAENLSPFDVEAITAKRSDCRPFDISGLDKPQLSISSSSSPLLSHDYSDLNAIPPKVDLLQESIRVPSATPSSLPLSRAQMLECAHCTRRFPSERRLK